MKLKEFFEQEAREEKLENEKRIYDIYPEDESFFLGSFQINDNILQFLLEIDYDYMTYGYLIPTVENMQSYINRLLDAEIKDINVEQSYSDSNNVLFFTIILEKITRDVLIEHSKALIQDISCDYDLKSNKLQSVEATDMRNFIYKTFNASWRNNHV